MLTQIVTTKLEIAKVAACDQTGLATRAKLVHFSLDSDACFIDAVLTRTLRDRSKVNSPLHGGAIHEYTARLRFERMKMVPSAGVYVAPTRVNGL